MSHFARYLLIVTVILVIVVIAVAYRTAHAPHKKSVTFSFTGAHTKKSNTSPKEASSSPTSIIPAHPVHSTEGRVVIHETDAQGIVHLTEGTQFVVSLGNDLSWQLVFSPANLVTPVLGTSVRTGIQGVYVATGVGTTILTATGAPICTPGALCPQFREHFSVRLDIQNAAL